MHFEVFTSTLYSILFNIFLLLQIARCQATLKPPGLKPPNFQNKKEQRRKQNLAAVLPPDTATQIPFVSFNHSFNPTALAFCHYPARREYLPWLSVISLVVPLPNSFLHIQRHRDTRLPAFSIPWSVCNRMVWFISPFSIHHLQTSVYLGSLQGGDVAIDLLHFVLVRVSVCVCVVCVSLHTRVRVCALEKGNVCLSSPYTRNPGQCDVELNKKLHE